MKTISEQPLLVYKSVSNKRAGWIFWGNLLSEQARNVRAGWKIFLKIVSEHALLLATAE